MLAEYVLRIRNTGLNSIFSASPEDPAQELTTEEMRKLIERNEIVPTTGLKPYNTVNV